jgi:hypothetical protein
VKRYTRDPQLREFQAGIRAEVDRITSLAPTDGYVIYAIRDPTKTDVIRAHPDGPPVYVGQTGELRTRADNHMRDGGGGSTDSGCKTGRLKQIIDQWRVPKFEILDTAPTHLTSLIAETVWARRFVWLGYELANRWAEHRTKERPDGLASVPPERLWDFTAANALEDEVRLTLECRACDVQGDVDLSKRAPTVLLKSVRSLKLECGLCGGSLLMDAKRPEPATWRWRDYQPAPMPPRNGPARS